MLKKQNICFYLTVPSLVNDVITYCKDIPVQCNMDTLGNICLADLFLCLVDIASYQASIYLRQVTCLLIKMYPF